MNGYIPAKNKNVVKDHKLDHIKLYLVFEQESKREPASQTKCFLFFFYE